MTRQLRIPRPLLDELRTALIREDGKERIGFLRCGRSNDDLTAATLSLPDDEQYRVIAEQQCTLDDATERDEFAAAFTDDLVPFLVHSHPFQEHPGFSSVDVEAMEEYIGWIGHLYPDHTFGFGVLGTEGSDFVVYDAKEEEKEAVKPVSLADWKVDRDDADEPADCNTSTESTEVLQDNSGVEDRYDRNVRALTEPGQTAIRMTTAAIVGLGGIGSLLAEQLCRLGVHRFVLIDPDTVEESNLSRLYGGYDHHVGRPKVDAIAEYLYRVNPDAQIATYQDPVQDVTADALTDVDVVMSAVDTVTARSYLNEYAVRHLQYVIDTGVRIDTTDNGQVEEMDGYVQTIAPGSTACFDCLGRGDPEQMRIEALSDDVLEDEVERGYLPADVLEPEPAVIHLNSVTGSMAVSQFSKLVTGFAAPADFLRYDGLQNEVVELTADRSPECVTCGDDAHLLGRGAATIPQEGEASDQPEADIDVPEVEP